MIDFSYTGKCEKVFYYFEEISKIPHGSGHCEKIADYLEAFAKERGLLCIRDKNDNVIIKKNATDGYENHPTVILQGHTDMVIDVAPGCNKDMENEGLALYLDGDFLKAEGTTLGGDDGVFVAYALAILDSNDITHPKIEALFTSDEEIGLIGATALDASSIEGRMLINIDSDVEGIFTVGCAGGVRTDIVLPYKKSENASSGYRISLSELRGGHSGTEIDKGRINAIKALCEAIASVKGVRISEICGGNADNAIPRNAECVIADDGISLVTLYDIIYRNTIQKFEDIEATAKIEVTKVAESVNVMSMEDSQKLLTLVSRIPSGVIKMSEDIEGLPETSANLGIISSNENEVRVCASIRSSKDKERLAVRDYLSELCREFGGEFSYRGEYPAWEYRKDSPLRDTMCRVYKEKYNKEPEVIAIHAGLECGIFSNKLPGLDCVSIGPDNFDIHTPMERLSVSSTVRVYDYLLSVLSAL